MHCSLILIINPFYINQFQPSATLHIETSHLICYANQVTGFYMNIILGGNELTHLGPMFLSCRNQSVHFH